VPVDLDERHRFGPVDVLEEDGVLVAVGPLDGDGGDADRVLVESRGGELQVGAAQLGVDAEALKRRIFAGAALLTSAAVAFAGPIGFVGLIVPQALRLLLGPDNRVVIPAALLGGGAFLLLADTLARNVIAPAELSVGVITAFCGAPFFIYLLRARTGTAQP